MSAINRVRHIRSARFLTDAVAFFPRNRLYSLLRAACASRAGWGINTLGEGGSYLLMSITARRLFLALISLSLLFLAGCSSTGSYKTSSALPVPPEIRDNVEFWRNVYGRWSRSQVAFHDNYHMGVIYEVATIPGRVKGGYTAEQKRFVKRKEAQYRDGLKSLEHKIAYGDSLTRFERSLRDKLVKKGGRSALSGASGRLRSQRGVRERFRRGVEISGRYDRAFRKIFRARGLPEDLAYLPHVESSFQTNARSSVGAAGVWQFMPSTGRAYDLKVGRTVDERLDPVLAANGAARYLGDAYRKLGSWPLAITSYNHGQGGMAKAKRLHGNNIGRIVKRYRGKSFGFASRNFYAEFIAAREVAGNPGKYFRGRIAYERPLDHDRIVLRSSMPARRLASHYRVSVYNLKDMNLAWRSPIIKQGASIPAGSTVWLPAGTTRRIASQPRYAPPVRIARVEPKRKPVVAQTRSRPSASITPARPKPKPRIAKASPKPKKTTKVAKASSKPKRTSKLAKVSSKSKSKPTVVAAAKTHVVKPNETLYRVSLRYDISVARLKRLNSIKPDDNTIRAGQRLKVSG